MEVYAAIDVGGTKIAVGIGTDDGELKSTEVMETDPNWAKDEVLDRVAGAVVKVRQEANVSNQDLVRVGLGTPGPLDGPVLLEASNLHNWRGLNWQAGLESRLHIPVAVENDATAAGIGEWMYGAGRGTNQCVYVTVSTGIGAGIVVNGQRYSGARGNAGEFGHLVMRPDGLSCPAGHRGCLETLASGTAIQRAGRERQSQSPYLMTLNQVETRDVFSGYEAGDGVCAAIIDEAADWLALGLSYLVDLFNPEIIVIGGGVGTHAPTDYRERLGNGIRRWALPALGEIVRLVPAQLGQDSGLMGALALAVMEN